MAGKLADPSDHSDKDIRKELKYWVDRGWILRRESHGFRLYCPCSRKCTALSIGSTPANPSRTARRIRAAAQLCPKDPEDPRRSLTGMDRGE
jgi:hypothetical protein